jgi:hypothetical protein
MRKAILSLIRDALRDQGTIAGNRMELMNFNSNEFIVKVWVNENGPPEYFTIKVTKNI